MSFFDTILLNLICIMFPMLIYIIFLANKNNIQSNSKEYNIIFDIVLVTTVYLIIKLTGNRFNNYSIILLNVPILFCYIKRKNFYAFLLSVVEIIYFSFTLDYNTIFLCVEYLVIFLFFKFLKEHNEKEYIDYFTLLKSLFFSFYMYYTNNSLSSIKVFCNILASLTVFYMCSYFCYIFLKKGEEIVDLNNTLKELEKEKTLRNSLFKLTHEIKNPIAVCKGYLDMLDLNNTEKTFKYIKTIKNEINRTLIIMDDFLDFTKIKIDKNIMDINYLLEDVVLSMQTFFEQNNIETNIAIKDEEIYIDGDYNRLKQVFVNIFKNAYEAKKNNLNLSITLKTKKNSNVFKIFIKDNGVGMSDEQLKNIGKMFYTTKPNGTGLGVSLCKEIIELHNGFIDYKSKEGKGTEICITLPVKKL